MRNKILSLVIIFMAAIDCVTNAQSIAVYFESIPEHILIQLDPNRRKDMVDLFMAGKPAVTRTKFGGPAELVSLNEKYLKIEIAENSIIEMALLGDTAQYIGVIKTICAPACDSEIEFYTTTWSPITSISVDKPGLKDFLYNIDGYGNGPLKPTWDGGNNIKNKNKIVEKSISGDSQDNQASEDLDSDIEIVTDEKLELQEIKDNRKIEDIVDFIPVRYEFVFNGGKAEETINAFNSLNQILTKQDFKLIEDKIATDIYLKINKQD